MFWHMSDRLTVQLTQTYVESTGALCLQKTVTIEDFVVNFAFDIFISEWQEHQSLFWHIFERSTEVMCL